MRVKVRDFLEQLTTGKSPIMVLLDGVLADPERLRSHPHFQDFRKSDHADTVCPDCREWLGLNAEQVDHINRWPAYLKERVREAMVVAIERGHGIEFFWRVTGKEVEQADIKSQGGHTTVRFASPRDVVRLELTDDGKGVEIEVSETLTGANE